ncbi:MAG: sigma-70 family RNA polymerase sigma factor [Chitinophagaceae bacterium]
MQKGLDETYLVNEVLSGSREAFVKLIKQYEGLVLHIVTPLIGVNEDREDICQDIFMKVYERLNTFQFRSKLGTWIGHIAYNTSINFLQKKRNILLSSIESPENETSFLEMSNVEFNNPEQIIIREEDINQLNSAIDKLTEFQKTVLLLFYRDEMSIDEINQITGLPVNTVKSHLFRARNSLKQLLNQKKTL